MLCILPPFPQVFGLLGVNGAGKEDTVCVMTKWMNELGFFSFIFSSCVFPHNLPRAAFLSPVTGKTTTFNMLTGHVAPSHGEASIMGNSVLTHLQAARRHLGYCPQFDATIYNMTGREHLRFYARLRGIKNIQGEREELVENLLNKLGLTEYADRLAGTYSGGNRRKLSVGIALIGDPDVVLLDEPSTGMVRCC